MVQATLTTVLSIWGAVLSTITVVALVVREWRDRPRLHVELSWEFEGPDGSFPDAPFARLIVEVMNLGRRPVTLREVMVAEEVRPDQDDYPPHGQASVLLDEFTLLGPYEAERWKQDRWFDVPRPHADEPMRAMVRYGRERLAWSEPKLVYRHWLECGWDPPASTPSELLVPDPIRRIARPVCPRWRVWLPKHLRVPIPTS